MAPGEKRARSKAPQSQSRRKAELPPAAPTWNLRLYVAGDSPKSKTALENLTRLCERRLPGAYTIEVVDLRLRPELAKADQILAIPTLIRKLPEPMKRIIGDLSDADRAVIALELGSEPVKSDADS